MNACPRCGCPSFGPRCRRCLGVTLPIGGSNGNGTGELSDLGLSLKKVVKKISSGARKVGKKLGKVGKTVAGVLMGGGVPLAPAEGIAANLEAGGITEANADAVAQQALARYRSGGGEMQTTGLSKALPYVAAGVAALAFLGVVAMTTGVRKNSQRKRKNVVER